ncbi:chemotaxis response regulator protein-glutamate methylesterase [Alteromonas sp. 5E99-2]|uniref:protein-glutamate methylesterase/protein-glutamine glutaminase n=1 Tax=Alteromonas sp. 5E99-2 TaxID=2817683 RepID=UPI001A99B45A|nr:chemotaxis response regulator protein-glutamate methylesterase [Alteromonas sp. 5E99-2]MBO1255209.1 chemotaxis response regulator protein-glutamate methylesterase [Alteromonas sp. 5E99-2]
MAFNVLVVDDSTFYRRSLRRLIDEDPMLNVVGEAKDGNEAIALAEKLSPDVITMDVEMPVLDGISAVRCIMENTPIPILMFSSLTQSGAQATLDALEVGALDFFPKKFDDISNNNTEAVNALRTKIRLLARRKPYIVKTKSTHNDPSMMSFQKDSSVTPAHKSKAEKVSSSAIVPSGKRYKCLAIGASTGGPVALQSILTKLPSNLPVPVVIAQHMPGSFTAAFAQRLNIISSIDVIHASNGMKLECGKAYIAPGGKQCVVQGEAHNGTLVVRDTESHEKVNYHPCVDITFDSLASVYEGDVLAVILTGMGQDGKLGCEKLSQIGATIWAQDESSSVVYGMPKAVTTAGIASKNISIDDMASCLLAELGL